MQILPPYLWPKPHLKSQRSAGFTLIEIIIVVAIIGTMVAFLGMSLSRDTDRMARLEAKRFHAVVNEVRDEAILAGQNYLLSVNDKSGSYSFSRMLADSRQAAIYEDGLLKPRKVQNGVSMKWRVFEQFENDDDAGSIGPVVLISSLGEITPFEASFIGDESAVTVYLDDRGQLAQTTKSSGVF
jgi:general secretion pathway protein H